MTASDAQSPALSRPIGYALVTGAGQRLGKAMALDLGRQGYAVAIHYNSSADAANDVVNTINTTGGTAVALGANLSHEAEVTPLINNAGAALGRPVNLLINCASTFENDDVDTMTRQMWDFHMEVNLRAPVVLTQTFSKQIDPRANNLVINMIDQRVKKPTPQFLSYTASKAALMALTITMAQGLGPKGIRVNGIGPGPTLRNKRQSEEDWRIQNEATILGHGATPADIVAAMNYLIDARAITGQMIAVDGGQHLTWQTPDVMINE